MVKTEGFLKLSPHSMLTIAKCDTLSIDEPAFFNAVVKWAECELARQRSKLETKKSADTTQNTASALTLRSVLTDIVPHIRFGCMTVAEFATLRNAEVLTGNEKISIFSYLGLPEDRRQSVKMPFSTVARQGSSWALVSCKTPRVEAVIAPEGKSSFVVQSFSNGDYGVALSAVNWRSGLHAWQVTYRAGAWGVCGVTPSNAKFTSLPYEYDSLFGWSRTCQTYPTTEGLGTVPVLNAETGDKVELLLDLQKNQYSLYHERIQQISTMPLPVSITSSCGWMVAILVHGPSADRLVVRPLALHEVHSDLRAGAL